MNLGRIGPFSGGGPCHFMGCPNRGVPVVVVCSDGRKVDRLACALHKALLREAFDSGLGLEVTRQVVVNGVQTGGTIWINTIPDFWYGKRKTP